MATMCMDMDMSDERDCVVDQEELFETVILL